MIALSIVGGVFLFLVVILIFCVAVDPIPAYYSSSMYRLELETIKQRQLEEQLRSFKPLYGMSMYPGCDLYTNKTRYTQGLEVCKGKEEHQDRTFKQLRNIERDLSDVKQILNERPNDTLSGLPRFHAGAGGGA